MLSDDFASVLTRKAQLTQRGTRDSDECVKARCERNLCSQFNDMFHLDSMADDA